MIETKHKPSSEAGERQIYPIRILAREARRLGFVDNLPHMRETKGCPRVMQFRLGAGDHFLSLQLWGDGNHRVAHGDIWEYGDHSSLERNGIPTDFSDLTGMFQAVAIQLIFAADLEIALKGHGFEPQSPSPAPAEENRVLRIDAERWRALMTSRMHVMGWANFDKEGKPKPDATYLHFGMEFWSRHPAQNGVGEKDNELCHRMITDYADTIRGVPLTAHPSAQALPPNATETGHE